MASFQKTQIYIAGKQASSHVRHFLQISYVFYSTKTYIKICLAAKSLNSTGSIYCMDHGFSSHSNSIQTWVYTAHKTSPPLHSWHIACWYSSLSKCVFPVSLSSLTLLQVTELEKMSRPMVLMIVVSGCS